jgi:hypothetical protein
MPAGLRRVIVSGRPVSPDAAALAVAAIAETGGSVDRVRALFGDPETGFELTVSGMTTGLDVRLAAVAGATGADITVEEVTDAVTDGRPQWQ